MARYCFVVYTARNSAYVSARLFMRILRASTHIENGTIQLSLNNRVIVTGNERYEAELCKGDYVIQWFVEGKPYTSFGITVSSPVTAEFQLIRRLDASGRDFGGFRFSI
jgi:hypothetical protein